MSKQLIIHTFYAHAFIRPFAVKEFVVFFSAVDEHFLQCVVIFLACWSSATHRLVDYVQLLNADYLFHEIYCIFSHLNQIVFAHLHHKCQTN